jgi:lysophospholipase L1-like esterase
MGGFTIARVPKHLEARCLAAHPDIVVLQFATSDLIVPIRRKYTFITTVRRKVSVNPPNLVDRLKWQIQGLVGDGLRLSPVTPREVYLATMNLLARTLLEHQVVPVVLSPFVFGARRSDRFARDCAGRLQQSLAALPRAVYVDAYSALDRHPRWRMLLCDGSHLSLEGQRVVGEALYPCLKNIVENQAWFPKNSPPPEKPETR